MLPPVYPPGAPQVSAAHYAGVVGLRPAAALPQEMTRGARASPAEAPPHARRSPPQAENGLAQRCG
ncbi:hypothetical protein FHS42_001655 [Streptomyces zagrosensis]|uniref:Uncharacterized protein n=1 Tax=Streptomyces zagrosensis TaxID=1042984 RepID=A0A7W9UX78_9ACTN|nr:hypothetical protein [Streptomyces zagrosensis]